MVKLKKKAVKKPIKKKEVSSEEQGQLTHKYRPNDWNTFVGNEAVVEAIQNNLEKDNMQRSIMLVGPYGTGKTTAARIIRNSLEISDRDYRELDIGSIRGIDNVKEIKKESQYRPLSSKYKMYVLDECFHKNTLIDTPKGSIKIKDLNIGDSVNNIYGKDIIENIFINKVSLDRIAKITTNNGIIFCSKEHKFFTDKGWKTANNLIGCNLYSEISDNIRSEELLKEGKYEEKKETNKSHLSNLQETIFREQFFSKLMSGMFYDKMQLLRKIIQGTFTRNFEWPKNMFSQLWGKNEGRKNLCEFSFKRSTTKTNCFFEKNLSNKKRRDVKTEYFQKNEKQQPYVQKTKYPENERNKKIQWYSKCLESLARWKWAFYSYTTTNLGFPFELGNGSPSLQCSTYQNQQKRMAKTTTITHLLQNRYSKQGAEDRDRSRWGKPQIFVSAKKRQEKRKTSKFFRVENIEIYQPGSNDESFKSIISDKERNQGYVEFYDLQIKNHPSYKANNCIVHNCHKMTREGMEAMLKWLEEPPKHVIIVIATTNPSQFPSTIISRCAYYEFKSLTTAKISKLIRYITEKEDIELSPEIASAIAKNANGSPRQAVSILDAITGITDEKKAFEIIERNQFSEASVLDICQGLVNGTTWKLMSKYLGTLDDNADYEYIRYAVLKYMSKVLLNPKSSADPDKICEIITLFSEPFFYSKKAGLISSCYLALKL